MSSPIPPIKRNKSIITFTLEESPPAHDNRSYSKSPTESDSFSGESDSDEKSRPKSATELTIRRGSCLKKSTISLHDLETPKQDIEIIKEDKEVEEFEDVKMVVQVAFEFLNIGEIDTLNEKFHAEVLIESKWEINSNLTVNEDIFDDYDPARHWNPRLFIENAIAIKEEISYETSEDQNVFYMTESRKIKVDVQELEIALTSKYGADKVDLVDDKQKISFIIFDATLNFRDQQKWKLFRLVTTGNEATYESQRNKYKKKSEKHQYIKQIVKARKIFKPPKIVAKCYAARRPGFYFMNAFFLVFLITTMTLATFSINFSLPHFRLQSTYVILLTSVSFKWVVNRSLPPVSYLTSLDAYQISCIFLICLLATWHAIVGAQYLLTPETGMEADRWALLTFGLLFVAMNCAYLIWLWYAYGKVRKIKRQEYSYFELNKEHFLPAELLTRRKSLFPDFSH